MKKNFKVKKFKSIFLSVILILVTLTTVAVGLENEETRNIEFNYFFEEPDIEKIEINGVQYDRVILDDCPYDGIPGAPVLPAKGAFLLLPIESKISNIDVTGNFKKYIGKDFLIEPMGEPIPLNGVKYDFEPTPNKKIYSENKFLPGKLFTEVGTYYFRGYPILVLLLHPIQYNPVSGELFYYQKLNVNVNTIDKDVKNPLFRGLDKDKNTISSKIDNIEMLQSYEDLGTAEYKCNLEYDLMILTIDGFVDEFLPLKQAHDYQGVSTVIKTLTDVGSSNLEDIRNYIISSYTNWGIEYVLIGGDDGTFPAPTLWVEGLDEGTTPYETYMPSDLYFACLDGPYNYDGDDKWGETNDGANGGDVDLIADVYVGRATVDNNNEVSYFVSKTIDYMNRDPSDPYLEKTVLSGEYLGNHGIASWGGNYMDQLKDSCSDDDYDTIGIPTDTYIVDELYDREWSGNNWPKSAMMSRINDGQNFINHLGHSNTGYNMKMYSSDVNSLTNDDYCFIYSQGCHAGGFDSSDCIAEYFTAKNNHAAFAGIFNARYGWFWSQSTDGDSQRFHREFWDAVFGEKMSEIGKANHDSKEDNLPIIGRSCIRWVYYETNLFGDPAVMIHGAGIRADFSWSPDYPNTNNPISFYDNSVGGQTFTWNFGDGGTSNQKNPVHTYTSEGEYEVTLTIYDEGESDYITKTVEVYDNWPPQAIAIPDFYAGNNPCVEFDSLNSWDPDGTISEVNWDFDDGTTSEDTSPTHCYGQDGIYYVTLSITDNGGKIGTDTCEIRIDAYTPPETEIILQGTPGNDNWFKGPVGIVFNANDWSGVDFTKYCLDGGIWQTYNGHIHINSNGEHIIEYYSVDIYGNIEETNECIFKIDNENPNFILELEGEKIDSWYTSPVKITCDATDYISGVLWIKYLIVDEMNDWEIYDQPIIISDDGSHILRIFVEDVAGNIIGKTNPYIFDIDLAPPLTSCIINGDLQPDGWYEGQVTIFFEVEDTAGVDYTMYRIDRGEWLKYQESFVITERGNRIIEYYSVDILGREEISKTTEFQIGAPPAIPTIDGPVKGRLNIEETWTVCSTHPEESNLDYYVDWGDGEFEDWFGPYASGEEVEITHAYTEEKVYTLKVKARDQWGGESDWGTLEFCTPKIKNNFFYRIWQFLQEIIGQLPILTTLLKKIKSI